MHTVIHAYMHAYTCIHREKSIFIVQTFFSHVFHLYTYTYIRDEKMHCCSCLVLLYVRTHIHAHTENRVFLSYCRFSNSACCMHACTYIFCIDKHRFVACIYDEKSAAVVVDVVPNNLCGVTVSFDFPIHFFLFFLKFKEILVPLLLIQMEKPLHACVYACIQASHAIIQYKESERERLNKFSNV